MVWGSVALVLSTTRDPAGHRGWAKAHDENAAVLRGTIPSLQTYGSLWAAYLNNSIKVNLIRYLDNVLFMKFVSLVHAKVTTCRREMSVPRTSC